MRAAQKSKIFARSWELKRSLAAPVRLCDVTREFARLAAMSPGMQNEIEWAPEAMHCAPIPRIALFSSLREGDAALALTLLIRCSSPRPFPKGRTRWRDSTDRVAIDRTCIDLHHRAVHPDGHAQHASNAGSRLHLAASVLEYSERCW